MAKPSLRGCKHWREPLHFKYFQYLALKQKWNCQYTEAERVTLEEGKESNTKCSQPNCFKRNQPRGEENITAAIPKPRFWHSLGGSFTLTPWAQQGAETLHSTLAAAPWPSEPSSDSHAGSSHSSRSPGARGKNKTFTHCCKASLSFSKTVFSF